MSESYVQVPDDGSGKKLHTFLIGDVHQEVMQLAGPEGLRIDPQYISSGSITNTVAVTGSIELTKPVGITGSISNTVACTGSFNLSNTAGITGSVSINNTVAFTGSLVSPVGITGSITNTVACTGSFNIGNIVACSGSLTPISSGSLLGISLTAGTGKQLVASGSGVRVKIYDIGFTVPTDAYSCLYFGFSGSSGPTGSKILLAMSGSGTLRQTFMYPRCSAAGETVFFYSTAAQASAPIDFGYIQEA